MRQGGSRVLCALKYSYLATLPFAIFSDILMFFMCVVSIIAAAGETVVCRGAMKQHRRRKRRARSSSAALLLGTGDDGDEGVAVYGVRSEQEPPLFDDSGLGSHNSADLELAAPLTIAEAIANARLEPVSTSDPRPRLQLIATMGLHSRTYRGAVRFSSRRQKTRCLISTLYMMAMETVSKLVQSATIQMAKH